MAGSRFRRLPALSALAAFEAVARLGSVTRAASELGLTQSAVSHQIRAMEEHIGRPLFRRDAAGTDLLPEAGALLGAVREGMTLIADAVRDAARPDRSDALTVSVLPGFAVKWLFPRLLRFDELYPSLDLSITTTAHLVDFASGEADVAIRYGTGRYKGLHVEELFDEQMFPVCSPGMAQGFAGDAAAFLESQTLLHDDIWSLAAIVPGWSAWFEAAGMPARDGLRGRRYGQSNMSIQAAVEGRGVALGRSPLVLDDLLAGRLARPCGPIVATGYRYYFVCPPRSLRNRKVAAFREWLMGEARDTRRQIGEHLATAA